MNLFFLPRTPFLLGGDQVFFWLPGLRMMEHARIYQDFYQFTPPGTDLLYLELFRIFGARLWVTNLFVLVLGVALCGLCFSICRLMMNRMWASLAAALFLVLVYCRLLSGTHHWLSVLCVMAAVKLRMRNTAWKSTLAIGGLLGLASFFTQTRGIVALAAFVFFLVWRQLRVRRPWADVLGDIGLLLSGFLAAWLLVNLHLIATIGFKQIWHFQATLAGQIIQVSEGLGLPGRLNLLQLAPYLFVYLLLAVIYPLTLWDSWRQREIPSQAWEGTTLLAIVGLFLLAEIAFGLNWLRLYTVSMPGFILLAWRIGRAQRIPRYAHVLLWIAIWCLASSQIAIRYRHQQFVADLPGGKVATSPEVYAKLRWLAERTRPGDYLFQAGWPGMYLPLGLRDPSYLESVSPFDGPSPRDIGRVPWELESRKVRLVVWSPGLDAEAKAGALRDSLQSLRSYLQRCYEQVYSFADQDQVWQRKAGESCPDGVSYAKEESADASQP